MTKKRDRTHIVIPGPGIPCPRCHKPTEIREHGPLGPPSKASYFSRWYVCKNKSCRTTMIMPPEFKVENYDHRPWWDDPQFAAS